MPVFLSLFAGAGQQFFTNAGVPLAGGKIYTYGAGGSTPQATYTTSAGNIAHSNPIVLDAAGRVPSGGEIWLTSNLAYKFVLQTAGNVTVQTLDNVGGGVDGASLAASSGSSLIGFLQSGSGAVARTVQSKLRDVVSVKDFGAVGDGVTDDTTAIQAAVNASLVVYVPDTGSSYKSGKITLRANQVLYGNGTLAKKTGTTTALIEVPSAANKVLIEGIKIDGGGLAGDIIAVSGADCSINLCEVKGTSATDVSIHALAGSNANRLSITNSTVYGQIRTENVSGLVVDGCKLYPENGTGAIGIWSVDPAAGKQANDFRITNNYMEIGQNLFGVVPLSRNGAPPPRNWVISNNVFISNFACYGAISIDRCGIGTVSGNTYRAVSGVVSTAGIEVPGSTDVTVVGNTIECNSLAATGITLNGSQRCTVSGNNISGATSFGIWVVGPLSGSNTSNNNVSSNTINVTDANSLGIAITSNNAGANVNDNLISGNKIYGSGGGTSDAIKFDSVTGNCDRNVVNGNSVSGTFRYGIFFYRTTDLKISVNTITATVTGLVYSPGSSTTPLIYENSWQYNVTAAPSSGTHFVSERYYRTPVVGQPKSWVCTVDGTPGTWVSEGNL